ncbi:hypothetical protein ACOMHN_058340 [Nucella lapillus]
MWSSAVTVPVSMTSTVVIPQPFAALVFSSPGFPDVIQHWHGYTELNSVASITRVISCLLIISTSGLQLPHIFRMLKTRRCEGVSLFGTAILLHSSSANVAYCINHNLPLSMWAESMPLMAQYLTLMCLLLLYGGHERRLLPFVLLYVLLMVPLLLGLVPARLVTSLRMLTLPLTLLAKVNELYSTYRLDGTGHTSKLSICILNLRSCGRLLTSLFDKRDTVLVLCYAHACLWNTLITSQTVYYGHKRRRSVREEKKRKESEARAARTSASESSSDSDFVDSDFGVARCRRKRRFNRTFSSARNTGLL